jgi:phosphoribosylformylglycinamidine synthase subunit PurQ / glutaminase
MKPMTIKAACITFPGSNCDQDIHRSAQIMGWDLIKLWHNDVLDEEVDIVFVPGGFSYGDYLRCGALAKYSRSMESVHAQAKRGGLVVGICNGFQILCEAGLLPGGLHRNDCLEFRCVWSHLRPANRDTAFTSECPTDRPIAIPIAHGEGNFHIDGEGLKKLQDNGQIAFEYCTESGELSKESNPNGSVASIAGVFNEQKNVLGMMPHPERAMEDLLGGTDGLYIYKSIEAALAKV